jgi:polyphosphate:AMP phosphotransferase
MFETAELGRTVAKEAFDKAVPGLRVELVDVQQRLRSADFPVLVLFSGVNGAGKSETINLLNEWMDPRWIESSAYQPPSDEERERPRFWRYWRDVPAKGRLGLFLSAWYSRPFLDHVYCRTSLAEFDSQLNECAAFERVLADDGALILKFWMHLGRTQQKQRLKALEKDPLQRWRITDVDWKHWRMYDRFVEVAEHTIRATSIPQAPWQIVEGMDPRYRSLTVATSIRDAIRARLEARPARSAALKRRTDPNGVTAVEPHDDPAAATLDEPLHHTVLTDLDMGLTVGKREYRKELPRLQGRVNTLFRAAKQRGISLVCVFEGWDAGGKGGAVRRLSQALDARDYRAIPIGSPNDEEAAHHYLWRFWRQVRRAGRVTIFDRSWYGRVLVERVEGFASPLEWRRAYSEINEFERQLTAFGIALVKFWLHIMPEEQLRRFEERQNIEYKRWKLTDEDWRNRGKWDSYERAVQEMVERTSTFDAPWTLVEGNCKRFARLKVLRTVSEALEAALTASAPTGSSSKKRRGKKSRS